MRTVHFGQDSEVFFYDVFCLLWRVSRTIYWEWKNIFGGVAVKVSYLRRWENTGNSQCRKMREKRLRKPRRLARMVGGPDWVVVFDVICLPQQSKCEEGGHYLGTSTSLTSVKTSSLSTFSHPLSLIQVGYLPVSSQTFPFSLLCTCYAIVLVPIYL